MRFIGAPYGGEDESNRIRRTPDGFFFLSAAVSCWCGEVNALRRFGDVFRCALHALRTEEAR